MEGLLLKEGLAMPTHSGRIDSRDAGTQANRDRRLIGTKDNFNL